MSPQEALAFIAAVAGMAGTTITLALAWMRHRERMAGARAGGSGPADQTVAMLTETLERQHDRQQALTRRLAALEAAGAPGAEVPPLGAHLMGVDDGEEAALDAGRTARVGVRV